MRHAQRSRPPQQQERWVGTDGLAFSALLRWLRCWGRCAQNEMMPSGSQRGVLRCSARLWAAVPVGHEYDRENQL